MALLTGGIASTPNATDAGFEVARVFDANAATFVRITGLTPGGPRAVIQKVWNDGKQRTLQSFALTSSPDTPTRDPLSWRIEALVAGSWTVLAVYTSELFTARGQRRVFVLPQASPAASGFRLVITERQDTPSTGNYSTIQLAELEFDGAVEPVVTHYDPVLSMTAATVRLSNLSNPPTIDPAFPIAQVIDGNTATDSRLVTNAGANNRWIIEWSDGIERRITGVDLVSGNGPTAEDPYEVAIIGGVAGGGTPALVDTSTLGAFPGRGQTLGLVVAEPQPLQQLWVQVRQRTGASGTGELIENTTGLAFRLSEIRLRGTVPNAVPTIGTDTGPTIVDDPAGQKVSIAGPVNIQGDTAAAVSVTLATEPAGGLLGPFPATLDAARIRWLFERAVEDIGAGTWRATITVSANGSTASVVSASTFAIDAIEGEPQLVEPVINPTGFKATSVLRADHPARAGMVAAFLVGTESSPGKIRNLVTGEELPVSAEGGAIRSVDGVSPFALLPTEAARVLVTGAIGRNPSAFSILTWVEPDAQPPQSAVRPAFFWQKIATGGNVVSLRRTLAADRLSVDVGSGATDFGAASLADVPSATAYPMQLDWDGTQYRHFRRGKPVITGASTPAPDNVVGAVFGVAGSGDPAAASWPGRYRYLIVWDRSQAANAQALVDGDVGALFTDTVQAPAPDPVPAGTAPAFTTPATLPAGTAGAAYSQQLAGTGSGALVYGLGSGAPAGWSVSASGLLTHPGPIAGAYSVPVVLTGSTAPAAARTFSVTVAATSSPVVANRVGLLLPMYIYPGIVWSQVNAQAANVETILIANPASGPGTSVDPNYTNAISAARAAGAKVVGYVSTSFTNRATADIKADIDRWFSLYGPIDGIFLDEFTNADSPAAVAFYVDLRDHVKAKSANYLVIGNPGSQVPQSYMAAADIMVVFENTAAAFASYTAPSWAAGYAGKRFAALVHATPDQAAMAAAVARMGSQNVGYGYVTSDVLPNPWDALPAYFEAEAAALHAQTISTGSAPAPAPEPGPAPTPVPSGTRFVTVPELLRDNAALTGSVSYYVLRSNGAGGFDMVGSGPATPNANGSLEVDLPAGSSVPAGATVLVGALIGALSMAGLSELRRDATLAVVQQR